MTTSITTNVIGDKIESQGIRIGDKVAIKAGEGYAYVTFDKEAIDFMLKKFGKDIVVGNLIIR